MSAVMQCAHKCGPCVGTNQERRNHHGWSSTHAHADFLTPTQSLPNMKHPPCRFLRAGRSVGRSVGRADGRAGGRSVGRSVGRARACDLNWRPASGHWVVADLFVVAGVRAHLRSDDTGQQQGQIWMSTSRRKRERRARLGGATGARRRIVFDWIRRNRTITAPAADLVN